MIRDAYRFLVPLLAAAAICGAARLPWIYVPCLALAGFVAYFFRNPRRRIPSDNKFVVSPADGKIVRIVPVAASEIGTIGSAVSIFLNIFDVHVNRSPIQGRLESLEYKRGIFKAAYDDRASRVNEQNILTIRGEGVAVVVKQIAGLIARRVVCWKRPGQALDRGELFGLIRFGSRVDIILPACVRVRVKVGDRVKGGSSVIGELE
jgi:phosphatidylserine decarboxylase